MKKIVLIGCLMLGWNALLAQLPQVFDGNHNSCEVAMQVCSNFRHIVLEQNEANEIGSIDCSETPLPLFYSFNFNSNNATSNIGFEVYNGLSGTYILYGPIAGSVLHACTQINANNAPYSYGNVVGGTQINLPVATGGLYVLQLNFDNCVALTDEYSGIVVEFNKIFNPDLDCKPSIDCANCITSFAPTPGDYVVSAWVKDANATTGTTTYTNASIDVSFSGSSSTFSLQPAGQIIDGWQRIEQVITIPIGATALNIALTATSGEAYFDDIRFFPIDGSMMSYVYDPISLRLMAELDERNYATLYEYDEEGKLIRVKKETERGIMTIQENRDNITKQ